MCSCRENVIAANASFHTKANILFHQVRCAGMHIKKSIDLQRFEAVHGRTILSEVMLWCVNFFRSLRGRTKRVNQHIWCAWIHGEQTGRGKTGTGLPHRKSCGSPVLYK